MTTTVQDPIPLEFNKLDGAFLPQLDRWTVLKHRLHQSHPLEIDALGSPPPLQLQSNGLVAVRPFHLEEHRKLVMGHERDCRHGLRRHGQLLEQFDNGVFLKNWCGINVWDRPRRHCKEFHEIWIRVSLVKGCIPMRLDVHGCLRCHSCQSQGNACCHPY